MKRKLAQAFVRFTDGWNKEFHEAIEANVREGFKQTFQNIDDIDKVDEIMKRMREFYYQRMMNTAMLLIAAASVMVALASLIVSGLSLATSLHHQ
jgi:hypothetical protein